MRQELLSLYVLSQILSFEHVPLTSCLSWEKPFVYVTVLKADESAISACLNCYCKYFACFSSAVNRHRKSYFKLQANVNKT